MKLDKKEVERVANLARLSFSPAEAEQYAQHLSSILEHAETLNVLDVAGIEPTAHAVAVPTPFREDVLKPDTTREASLQNAPQREGPFFKVPKVIG